MAQTPEKKVKDRITRCIKDNGGWECKPIMQGMGQNGTPDILACVQGWFFGIEAKAGKGKPTELQKAQLRKIRKAGGIALVVNEKNFEHFEALCAGESIIHPSLTAMFDKGTQES